MNPLMGKKINETKKQLALHMKFQIVLLDVG